MNKGFICIATLDRLDELRRFLTSFLKFNSTHISVILAHNTEDAHRLKTRCAFLTPYDWTVMLDIDMLINGNLDELFKVAETGNIGLIREQGVKCLNSGVVVFPAELMKKVCTRWNQKYERKLIKGYSGKQGVWDQDILITIINDYPYVELEPVWNLIVKDRSPEEEIKIYDTVKIFHFMHANDYDRTKYKSYQEFMRL